MDHDRDVYAPTTEKTHPALYIPEILLEIFTTLLTTDLVRAARTCKTWVGHALDIKWRTRSVKLSKWQSYLCELASASQTKLGHELEQSSQITLQYEQISLSHWAEFVERFAGKVTWLELNITLDLKSLALVERLLERFGGPLCRNLSRIDAQSYPPNGPNDCCTALLELLLSSNLEEVGLPWDTAYSTTRANLSLLARRSPHILNLTVSKHEAFNYAIFTNLRSLWHYGSLSLADYTMLEIFRAIEQSMMPALRTFHIDGARLTLLDHVLQASPLLEDLHLEINTSSRELKLRTHERIRTLVLTNDVDSKCDWKDDNLY
ncbi:hypothetical protein FRB95_007343 [Tulasnella sp. JGI-2019a]|nr:hypothetical protein FRB95_007343 [Tulasnella sp. JGI-2019a]